MNNLMSASGLERSLNLAGIWPVNLQYLIPKTGALSTNKLFCGALFRCQDPAAGLLFAFALLEAWGGTGKTKCFVTRVTFMHFQSHAQRCTETGIIISPTAHTRCLSLVSDLFVYM